VHHTATVIQNPNDNVADVTTSLLKANQFKNLVFRDSFASLNYCLSNIHTHIVKPPKTQLQTCSTNPLLLDYRSSFNRHNKRSTLQNKNGKRSWRRADAPLDRRRHRSAVLARLATRIVGQRRSTLPVRAGFFLIGRDFLFYFNLFVVCLFLFCRFKT
jgi:hypothetical protein